MKSFSLLSMAVAISMLFLSMTPSVTARHNPSTHCNVYDLLEDCKDSVVDVLDTKSQTNLKELDNFLIQQCQSFSGMIVAKCLMKYLCENHGEASVDRVRDCVIKVCPLAKRLPKKVCVKPKKNRQFLRQ